MVKRIHIAIAAGFAGLLMASASGSAADGGAASRDFNVRDFGAAGDRATLDTPAINKAIEACAAAGGGRVRFPPGAYLAGTVHLRSHTTLFFEAGARLVGTTNLTAYQQPTPPAFMPEARWGKWHRGLILGENLEDIAITGPGIIDGNKVFDPTGEERMRGPHTIVLVNCRSAGIRDVSIIDSANYAVFFQVSDQVEIRDVKVAGGWDGVHFRGTRDRPCRDVSIIDCQFHTGDDSIAGRYWDNTLIRGCIINSSCNGIRVIGPVQHLIVQDCLFYGPGLHPHRTSNRTNMLAGLNLQPGAWDATAGLLDDVFVSDLTMRNVATPFHFVLKPGNTAGRIQVNRVSATGVYRAASSIESWAETPFTNVVFRDVTIECDGGGAAELAQMTVKAPGVDARPLPAWGFYARHVQNLTFDQVRLRFAADDFRPVLAADRVDRVMLDDFRFDRAAAKPDPFRFTDVAHIQWRGTDLIRIEPRVIELKAISEAADGRLTINRAFNAIVTVEGGDREGLGLVELELERQKLTRWVWLVANEKKEIGFSGLVLSTTRPCELRCQGLSRRVQVEP